VLTLSGNEGTLLDRARDAPETFDTAVSGPDDLAAILYTSGTTGRAKGAMLTHRNLASNALTLVNAWGFTRGDVLLHALPLYHVHGLFVACHCALLSGSRMLWLPRFDAAEVIGQLPHASVMMGVPTFYTRLLAEPRFAEDLCRSVRLFISGSAPLLPETFNEFRSRSGHAILERYGMSETGMNTSNPLHGERICGSVGPPLPGVTLRVVDCDGRACPSGAVGGVEVKGPNVFAGYWRMPDKTREEFTADDFFRTGDLGELLDNGYLKIVGRAKDLIITGGLNVYPKEIEERIDALPGIAESAVIGVPDRDFGEAVTAIVVAKAGQAPSEADLIAALKAEIAQFKVPKSKASKAPVPMHPVLAGFLMAWRERTPYAKDDDYVFPSFRLEGKKPLSASIMVQKYLRPAAIKAGVIKEDERVRFGFHNFRHSLASSLVKLKCDPKTVQGILRHEDVRTTMQLYAQSDQESRLEAQGKFLALLLGDKAHLLSEAIQ